MIISATLSNTNEYRYHEDYDKLHYLTTAFDAVMDWCRIAATKEKNMHCHACDCTHSDTLLRLYTKLLGVEIVAFDKWEDFSKMLGENAPKSCTWYEFLECGYAIIAAIDGRSRLARDAVDAIQSAVIACGTKYDAEAFASVTPARLGYYLIYFS